ncbi:MULTISPECIES: M23 family metallopeptidase [Clostridium]|uniref:M23 family metallopeptidase n=1 Tax=Clostridium senegalense TaxID=1465809 RepID=A0A6M0H723_9CLOT|nr:MULTISPECIES: M23 family metallopeptidase [Clostridium]NEU06104.1 M23 family metallopeptidase [Clostridium senegalense]
MDKKTKFKQFFKKEGFYVILFVCLCAVATVTILTTSKDKRDVAQLPAMEQKANKETKEDKQTNGATVEPKTYNDALQVKKEELKAVPEVQVQKNAESQSVSNATDSESVKPVDGSLARSYTEDPVYMSSTKDYRPHFGIDVKVEEGTPVVAMMNGVIKNVDTSSEGTYVEIDHQNGIVSRYSNLQEKVAVKKGDSVKGSQEIGKVGNTTTFAYEEYGSHLHFEVLKDGENIDPSKYVNYKK